jgi:hypothetical protein
LGGFLFLFLGYAGLFGFLALLGLFLVFRHAGSFGIIYGVEAPVVLLLSRMCFCVRQSWVIKRNSDSCGKVRRGVTIGEVLYNCCTN